MIVMFREQGTIFDIALKPENGLEVTIQVPQPAAELKLAPVTAKGPEGLGDLAYTVTIAREPGPKMMAWLQSAAERKLPQDHVIPEELANLARDGVVPHKWYNELVFWPQAFQQFEAQVASDIHAAGEYAVKCLRWRLDAPGGHRALGNAKGIMFSLDGQAWSHMPMSLGGEARLVTIEPVPDGAVEFIESGVAPVGGEPLGHELLREARARKFADPRSSLLLAVTAAEVGMKEIVSDLCPDTTWLVENLPSPPVVKMLRELLPILPAKAAFGEKVLPPSEKALKVLTDAVNMRNRLTHTGRQRIEYEKLDEILTTVQDMLRLLDYYRGYTWALDYMSAESRQDLNGRS